LSPWVKYFTVAISHSAIPVCGGKTAFAVQGRACSEVYAVSLHIVSTLVER
jgi:hypothetical protein